MKNEKFIRSIGNIEDKFIEEANPKLCETSNQKVVFKKRKLLSSVTIAACIGIFIFGTTAIAATYVQSSISAFYLRYLSSQEMAVSDSMSEQYGAKIYFEGLKSDDSYKQYFAINKLVEYYNDENVRLEAIKAISPFITNEDEKLANAAEFALSVLTKSYDNPNIYILEDGTIMFTLFNNYSDYGSFNELWTIKNDELSKFYSFDKPSMYITSIVLSPDKKNFAVTTCSNKSEYLVVFALEKDFISPELIDSARYMVGRDKSYEVWQRIDYENYSSLSETVKWADNNTIEFNASLSYDNMDIIENVSVTYDISNKKMEYKQLP